MSESIRTFIAVKMPSSAIDRLREAQDRLRTAEADWRWVKPDTFHITLKFLGNVEQSRMSALWESVCGAVAESRPFTMALRGLGAFPNVHTARVAWVGIDEGAAELVELAAKVDGACEQHGVPSESRPFRAHLTLGRARRPAPNPPLAAAIEGMAGTGLGEAGVDRILLMESRLTPRGAQYEVLEEHLLNHGEAE